MPVSQPNINRNISICGINVCGLTSKLDNGYCDLFLSDFDILCISETKTFMYDLSDTEISDFKVFTPKGFENKIFGSHGLCICIRNHLQSFFTLLHGKSENVVWLKVNAELIGIEFVLGAVYIPGVNSDYYSESIFEDIYLDIVSFDLPTCLIGDFNSRISTKSDIFDYNDYVVRNLGIEEVIENFNENCIVANGGNLLRCNEDVSMNSHGRNLLNMCHALGLNVVNGRFGQDIDKGNFTCHNNNGKSTIDLSLVSPILFKHLVDFEVEEFDDLLSDTHSAIVLSLSDIGNKVPNDCTKFIHSRLLETDENEFVNNVDVNEKCDKCNDLTFKWGTNHSEMYSEGFNESDVETLLNKLNSVVDMPTQGLVDDVCKDLNSMLIIAAKECGICKDRTAIDSSKSKTKNHKPWYDTECAKARSQYYKVRSKIKFVNPVERHTQISAASKRLKEIVKKKKSEYFKSFHKKLRVLKSNNSKEYWNLLNKFSSKKNALAEIDLEIFREHFKKISNKETDLQDNNIDYSTYNADIGSINEDINMDFTYEEVKKLICKLKNGKACGIDHIRNEFLKNCPDNVVNLIVKLFNIVLNTGIMPEEWCIGMIMPLYKNKGSPKDPDNYRGITLLSCIGKLFTSVINNRLTHYIDATGSMGDEQAGFRHGYSTMDHIFTLHAIINMYLYKGKRVYCAFIDYRKAFDFVDRSSLWCKLLGMGINGKIINVIRNLYSHAKSCVKLDGKLSEYFSCNVGVRQGENLSPLLFAIFLNDFELSISKSYNGLDDLANETKEQLSDDDVEYFIRIFTLLYADDTIVMAESAEELQLALNAAHTYCKDWDLTVNTDKTKIVIFARGKVTIYPAFLFGHNHLEVVDEYTYLGTVFNYNGSFSKAISKQVLQASKAFYGLLSKIKKLRLPVDLALELFDHLVLPIMLYGCEVWGFGNINELEILHRKFIKILLGLNSCTPNVMVYGETGRLPIINHVISRMTTFYMRLINGNKSKLSFIMYKVLRKKYDIQNFQSAWLQSIETSLNNMGMRDIWLFEGMSYRTEYVKQIIKCRLRDMYRQEWSDSVLRHQYCNIYALFKDTWNFEKYLVDLNYYNRIALAKFRCRSNYLPISKTRFNNHELADLLCPLCDEGDIGGEFHYIFKCSHFHESRKKYISERFIEVHDEHTLKHIFICTGEQLVNLCAFVSEIMECFKQLNSR